MDKLMTIGEILTSGFESIDYLVSRGFLDEEILTSEFGVKDLRNKFLMRACVYVDSFNDSDLKEFSSRKLVYACESGNFKLFLVHPEYLKGKHELKGLTKSYLEFFTWRVFCDIFDQSYFEEKSMQFLLTDLEDVYPPIKEAIQKVVGNFEVERISACNQYADIIVENTGGIDEALMPIPFVEELMYNTNTPTADDESEDQSVVSVLGLLGDDDE